MLYCFSHSQDNIHTKGMSVLKGFREFVMRGNVVELAVAVIIGAAFGSVVTSVVKNLVTPVIGAFGSTDLSGYYWCMKGTCSVSAGSIVGVGIGWGAILTALINFLIAASAIYFLIVLPFNTINEIRQRRAQAQEREQEQAVSDEVALLTEIRDALVARSPEK
ncbi:MAG: large conductance mechanosensitive channel protein MscL [Actinomycetes bacterium]